MMFYLEDSIIECCMVCFNCFSVVGLDSVCLEMIWWVNVVIIVC